MKTSYDPNIRPSLNRVGQEIRFHQKMVENLLVPSCINCEHWGENTNSSGISIVGSNKEAKAEKEEVCRLYKSRPPAETIVFGCPSWVGDIPF